MTVIMARFMAAAVDDDAHAVQVVGYAVSRDLRGTEARDDADDQHTAELEYAVFDAARDADAQDPADDGKVRLVHAVA